MKKYITLFLFALLTFNVHAKNISVIIPFSPGGPTDQLWRGIEPELNERLKKHNITLVTEYMQGAGGAIAANKIAETKDRLQLGFFSPALAISPSTNAEIVKYNSKSFRLIGYSGSTEMMVVSSLDKNTILEKCRTKEVSFGSSNVGSTSHLFGLIAAKELNCKNVIHVPYRGISAAYLDVLSGRIDYLADFAISAEAQMKSGKINKILDLTNQNLDNWHVLIANNITDDTITVIQNEFNLLKKDKSFVSNLEKNFRIKNFSTVKPENWLDKEFDNYQRFIKNNL